ncbi:MAG TPA: MarR family transcriptional regulator [Candidatus Limnocylindrales bacterium]|jgi:DNA-binding MarR family transcriptional regulator|nr:MarR family transcriptional regulator [Candidatus Limnocylindrales bacterium]
MPEDQLVDAIDAIIVAGVAMTSAALSHAAAGPELTFPQWRVLVVLSEPTGLPVTEVSRRIAVTLPATGRQLRRLEQRGFLTLEPDAFDRRVTRARLTRKGLSVRNAIIAERRDRIIGVLEALQLGPSVTRSVARIAIALEADGAAAAGRRAGRVRSASREEV